MRLIIITGSLPPEPCGVGDYSVQLARSIRIRSNDAVLIKLSECSLRGVFSMARHAVVHVQYPSRGYGASLLPQLLVALSKRAVVTIHEFSQVHPLRKLAIVPLLLFGRKIIVTNDFEREAVVRWLPFARSRIFVVPVGAAVLPVDPVPSVRERTGLVFFGLIRPDKGVEEFIQLARLLKSHVDFPVAIYSAVPSGNEKYYADIRRQASNLPIEWHINEPLHSVSVGLLRFRFAYLHFSDGLSERRSSFIAAINHGLIVLSNASEMTPLTLDGSFVNVADPVNAGRMIDVFDKDLPRAEAHQERAIMISRQFSWAEISSRHIEIYNSFEGINI